MDRTPSLPVRDDQPAPEPGDRRMPWLPWLFRGIAWAVLALLLLNPGCPAAPAASRPLVLLDGSLSMTASGGRWRVARAEASRLGEVRLFGDPGRRLDSALAGESRLAPALSAAAATGRPIVVITDGEISDADALGPSLRGRASVRLFPRTAGVAARVRNLTGPGRVTDRDTVRLRVDVETRGLGPGRQAALAVWSEGRELARTRLALDPGGSGSAELVIRPGAVPPGEHVLAVGLADSLDPERRDDRRLQLLTVSRTPGLVLVAAPADWDARFLYHTLREVTALPVEGYAQLERGGWRRMSDLKAVDEGAVRRAVTGATMVVLRGAAAFHDPARGHALLDWPVAEDESVAGDWYLSAGGDGPLPGALAGAALDSFPPATALAPLTPVQGDWVGMGGQAGRRGAIRPAIIGGVRNGARTITVGAQGLYRWPFRGGSSEQAWRALVAAMADWLLASPDSARGRVRLLGAVVPQGRPVTFAWNAVTPPVPIAITFRAQGGGERRDSLRFDGSGTAALFLDPGVYTYGLEQGGRGVVAVESWSDEWYPHQVALAAGDATTAVTGQRVGLRDRWWLFALAIGAWCAEWVIRRRRGLR